MAITLFRRRAHLRAALTNLLLTAPTNPYDNSSPREYVAAEASTAILGDILAWVGAVEFSDEDHLRLRSIEAAYFVRQLLSFLEYDAPLVTDWTSEGVLEAAPHPFGSGVDLCAALERHRLTRDPAATPIREFAVAIGLIVASGTTEEPRYLLSWDAGARAWQLIGGRIETSDASPEAALRREIAEELGCEPFSEDELQIFLIGEPFEEQRVSPTYGVLSRATFHAFHVRFLTPLPPMHPSLRWVSAAELATDTTYDGQAIAGVPYRRLVQRVEPEEQHLFTRNSLPAWQCNDR